MRGKWYQPCEKKPRVKPFVEDFKDNGVTGNKQEEWNLVSVSWCEWCTLDSYIKTACTFYVNSYNK